MTSQPSTQTAHAPSPGAPDDSLILRNVRPWGADACDVVIAERRISDIRPIAGAPGAPSNTAREPASPAAAEPTRPPSSGDVPVVEGRGRLLVPSFSDVHVHLDSTRLGLPFRPHTGAPGVWGMMLNDRRNWRHAEASITERTTTALRLAVERGTTRVRSYAQVDVDAGLERFEAVVAARDALAERCEVEIIAFPQAGLLREEGSIDVLEAALRAGADVVGGIDPCQLDRDPVRHLDAVFGLAEKYGVPIDIHLHEPADLARFTTELILERTEASGLAGRVTISHGYGLAGLPEAQRRDLWARMADLDVSMATIAPMSGPLPLAELAEAGVRVGLGQDGQRDYWSPYGNADMLDRTWQLAFTHGYRADEMIEHCLAVAGIGGASVIDPSGPRLAGVADLPGVGIGDVADLVLLAGDTPAAAVMDRSPDRTVIHRGRLVADGLELV